MTETMVIQQMKDDELIAVYNATKLNIKNYNKKNN